MSDRVTYRDMEIMEEVLNQGNKQVCWAISLTRQLAALLKIRGALAMGAKLSIQYLINKVGHSLFEGRTPRAWSGGIRSLQTPIPFLLNGGSVYEHVVPLSNFDLQSRTTENILLGESRFRPVQIIIHRIEDYPDEAAFEEDLMRCLRKSPVTAAVKVYPSLREVTGTQIYKPLPEETGQLTDVRHCMLLVKSDRNRSGVPFWEFQDSYGPGRGKDGYIRIRKGERVLTRFVEMVLLEKEPEKEKRKRKGAVVDGGGGSGGGGAPTVKKMRGRPSGSSNWQKRQALGSTEVGFAPHVLTVGTGEVSLSNDSERALAEVESLVEKEEKEVEGAIREIVEEEDGNGFSAVGGAHKNLKRAEKARILISKIPVPEDALETFDQIKCSAEPESEGKVKDGSSSTDNKQMKLTPLAEASNPIMAQDMSAAVIEGNDAVTGHIISTTIGGKNGEPKQIKCSAEPESEGKVKDGSSSPDNKRMKLTPLADASNPIMAQDMSAAVIEGNDAVTGHIISTTIGGKNGEPKQFLLLVAQKNHNTKFFMTNSPDNVPSVEPICFAHLAAAQLGTFMKFEDQSETSSSHGGVTAPGPISVAQLPKLKDNIANSMFFC